jgi:hypothetical protein
MKVLQWVWFLILATLLPGFVNNTFGQDLSSDRPTFTTGPDLMDLDAWQLELGYTYRDDASDGDSDVGSFPETLVRYGWRDNIELRFGWNGYDFTEDASDKAGDTSFGIKYAIEDDLFGLGTDKRALIATVSIPTGGGQSELDPSFVFGWDKALDDTTTLSGNFGIGFPSDEMSGDRFTQGIFSLMCSRDLGDGTSVFGEYYTNFPAADEEDAEHMLQAGVLHMISPDTQLDFRVGIGLNNQADDFVVGVGITHAIGRG